MNPTNPANADAAAVIAAHAAMAVRGPGAPVRLAEDHGATIARAVREVQAGDKVVPAAMTAGMIVAEAVRARILNAANPHRYRNSIARSSQTKRVWIP